MDLSNATVVVTGASRGIGRALTLRLAARGATVLAGARSYRELESLAESSERIVGLTLDVADPASVHAFCDEALRLGAVDVLVNNAGVGAFGTIEELTLEQWDRVFAVNVRGTFLMTRHLLPSIRARSGHVVNVTSDVSARTFAGGALYTASKYAQRAFTQALQMEVADDGVRVTEIRPGVVATHFGDTEPQKVDADALGPDDVAEAIEFALTRPARMRFDELHFHPMGQTPEF